MTEVRWKIHHRLENIPSASSSNQDLSPLCRAKIVGRNSLTARATVDEVSAAVLEEAKKDAGVANLVALVFPEIKSIARLQVFESRDRLSDQSLIGGNAGKVDADLSKELLDKSGAVNALF